jgi:hemolysin III
MDAGAALASVVGAITLMVLTRTDLPRLFSMAVFSLSLVGLFSTSSIYHSMPWTHRWKVWLQKLDHSMIFVVVAASYTPLAVNVLSGRWRWVVLVVVWSVALLGIVQKFLLPKIDTWFSITLQTTLGWFAVVPLVEFIRRLSGGAIVLMLGGGLLYMIGMILFTMKRPRLSPRVFSYHEVFHVFVIGAAALHFTMMLVYVVPYSGV